MRQLAYCILRADTPCPRSLPAGVEGATVSLVAEGELAAAVSRASSDVSAPDPVRATAYAGVIAALALEQTVLPVRYGCLFGSRTEVQEFLRARRAGFTGLLEELDGCVEMGIRALVPRTRKPAGEECVSAAGVRSGAAYLRERSAAYTQRDAERQAGDGMAAVIQRTFDRLSVQSRAIPAVVGENVLVSMYFLIRRQHMEAFRREFRRLQEQVAYRLLLSGPWAPYSFVADREPGGIQ